LKEADWGDQSDVFAGKPLSRKLKAVARNSRWGNVGRKGTQVIRVTKKTKPAWAKKRQRGPGGQREKKQTGQVALAWNVGKKPANDLQGGNTRGE